jgi:hypothetical protein
MRRLKVYYPECRDYYFRSFFAPFMHHSQKAAVCASGG